MSTENLKLAEGETDPLLGKVLDGRYEIQSVLGEGGMGLVYRAKHVTLGKKLAIKVLRAEVSKDQEIVQRFRQEAQSATSIGNHHIIDISDFGVLPDGSTYFVMEYLDGKALTKAIDPDNALKAGRTIHIAKQLCRALGAAHEIGIVHRDLKPDNIFLISRGGDPDFVKVLDFGIAKVVGQKSKLTQVGQVFGTPHYMSPEQCAGTAVDKRTDIYALGVIMYEMGTSRVPFDADNLMGILTKHLYEEPVAPSAMTPPVDMPPELEAVVLKCLAKKADERYQTMQELLSDLELVEQGLPPGAASEPRRTTQTGGTARTAAVAPRTGTDYTAARPNTGMTMDGGTIVLPQSKNTGLFIGVAIAAVVLVGGSLYAFSGSSEPAPTAEVKPAEQPAALPAATTPPQPSDTNTNTNGDTKTTPPEALPTGASTPEPTKPAEPEEKLVRVKLTSTPEGAEVFADGALLGHTPFDIDRPKRGESEVELTLKLAGYKDQPVRVSAYTQEKLTVGLEKKRATTTATATPTPKPAPTTPVAKPEPKPEPKPEEPQRRPRTRPSTEVLDPWN